MVFQALGQLEFTDEETRALEIVYALALNAKDTHARSVGDYLGERVQAVVASYVREQITAVQDARFKVTIAADRLDAASRLSIDLTVPIPVVKPDSGDVPADAQIDPL